MSDENKGILKESFRYFMVVGLIVALIIIQCVGWYFPRNVSVDDKTISKIEEMSKTFNELKSQNQQIITSNLEANKKLSALMEKRGGTRDKTYEELLDLYERDGKAGK